MLIVLKYGGNAMLSADAGDPLLDDIAARVRLGDGVVLVHGGGPAIDAALARAGVSTERIDGLRVTNTETLAITESVLCGTVNKQLVRELMQRGILAAGISGQDAATLVARKLAALGGVSLGFVGEIERVRTVLLEALLNAGIIPVVAPVAVSADARHALNVNADTSAGVIAGALKADAYIIVTNVQRVRRVATDPATGIASLTVREAQGYLADGTFEGGMMPKIKSALDALARGAREVLICGSGPGALSRALAGEGTTLVRD